MKKQFPPVDLSPAQGFPTDDLVIGQILAVPTHYTDTFFSSWSPYAAPAENAEFTHTASVAQGIGDLLWWDLANNELRGVDQIADQGTAALTQRLGASTFAGVGNSKQLSTDQTAQTARLIIDQVIEYACVSNTFNPNDYVTFKYTFQGVGTTGALSLQTVDKTSDPSLAIGRVVKQYTAATTKVKVRLMSHLFLGFIGDFIFNTNNQAVPGTSGSTGGQNAGITGGVGYAVSTGNAGAGGTGTFSAGAGGQATGTGASPGGVGGAWTGNGGAGGTAAGTSAAGAGGAWTGQGGAGAAKTGTGPAVGGAGGAWTGGGGAGGATASSGANAGGAGGMSTLAGGAGGNASAGTGNGGAGGNVVLSGGVGGTSSGGSAGAQGIVQIANNVAPPAAGSAGAFVQLSSTASFGIYFGSGAPTVAAAQGSIYMRTDGSSASTRMYINTTGAGTWTNVTTAA
ncbi:MAG: hypothetical protein ACRESF_01915 [Pseudomonas sp.]